MRIVKVATSGNDRFKQRFYVFDEMPDLTYERIGSDYVGSVTTPSGAVLFSRWLRYRSCKGAFAGNTLHLHMKDGTTQEIKDWWWDEGSYPEHGSFYSIGAATIDELQRCYVYCSCYVNKEAFCELLNEYYSNDMEYTYREVEDWVNMQHTWYPVILDGKSTRLMVNKDGKFADMYTQKPQYGLQHNVCKMWFRDGKLHKKFNLCFFEWKRVEDGRLVKTQRRMTDVLKASLPEDIYLARIEDMKRKRLISTSLW